MPVPRANLPTAAGATGVNVAASGDIDPKSRKAVPCPAVSAEAINTGPGTACGSLECRAFPRAEAAINYLLLETQPTVLAVGEIHAQKNTDLKTSPTQRFASLLPMFCGKSQHIVIELWTSRNDCGDKRVERVREVQKPVTAAQAPTNQNEFLELGHAAKANGIQPHALVPSCEDFQSILTAKDQDIARMLELTATRSAELAEGLLKRPHSDERIPRIILYGGAMHNDVSPAEGRESFSYGPRLEASTGNRLTELDLVLREQVKDSEIYRRLAWYPHFRAEGLDRQYILYRLGPRSFTLIYPNETHLR